MPPPPSVVSLLMAKLSSLPPIEPSTDDGSTALASEDTAPPSTVVMEVDTIEIDDGLDLPTQERDGESQVPVQSDAGPAMDTDSALLAPTDSQPRALAADAVQQVDIHSTPQGGDAVRLLGDVCQHDLVATMPVKDRAPVEPGTLPLPAAGSNDFFESLELMGAKFEKHRSDDEADGLKLRIYKSARHTVTRDASMLAGLSSLGPRISLDVAPSQSRHNGNEIEQDSTGQEPRHSKPSLSTDFTD